MDYKFRFAQLSDLHIQHHRDLLTPIIDRINNEGLDLVVVTGDLIHEEDEDLYKKASALLNKIKTRVVVVPGEYDGGPMWDNYFGSRYKSAIVGDYCMEFLDTSYMKHRFAVGWSDTLRQEDDEQYRWLKRHLKDERYHIIFSHHPFWTLSRTTLGKEFLANDNIRAFYSGHLREPSKFFFEYDKPKSDFKQGFGSVPLKFHGSSCYLVSLVNMDNEIVHVPRMVRPKQTAW